MSGGAGRPAGSAARRGFDALERGLAALATFATRGEERPGAALRVAGALGWLRNRLSGAWPSPRQVATLSPRLEGAAAARIAWQIGALEGRNRLLVEILRRRGLGPVRPLLRRPAALAALAPPLILGTFHTGALQAIGAVAAHLPAPTLAFRHGILTAPQPPLDLVSTEGGDQARAAAFYRGLDHLRRGGFVLMALDLPLGPGIAAPCLGHRLALARGPFALARLAPAPIVPIVARWRRGGTIEIVLGEPLASVPEAGERSAAGAEPLRPQHAGCGAGTAAPTESSLAVAAPPTETTAPADMETALAAAAATWLERYLVTSPAELGLGLLRDLLAAGPALPSAPARRD